MRLGVLGGTFDPVHVGHLITGEYAREELELDGVLFVPAGEPWRKIDHEITPGEDRLEMLRLATSSNPYFDVSPIEVERQGPSYTEVTLEALLKEYGEDTELFFILGRDAFEDLPHWHAPARIAELATLVVVDRVGAVGGSEAEPTLPGVVARLHWLQMPRVDVNSSDIRERVANDRSIRYRVPDSVAVYIAGKRLYSA